MADPYCIDRRVIGTEKHLLCLTSSGGDSFVWSDDVPSDCWHLDGTFKDGLCLDTLARLGGLTLDLAPEKKFVSSTTPFLSGSGVSFVPWQHLMPGKAHRDFVKRLVTQAADALARGPKDYYRDTWGPGNAVLSAIKPAKVDERELDAIMDRGEGNLVALESFRPVSGGFASPVVYDRFGTLTGRLTVSSGPQLLTLNKEFRKIIKPSFSGGQVLMLDFAALEARVLLYEAGRRCDVADLYGMISSELGYVRDDVKAAVISELYGSSKWALGKRLEIGGKELDSFVGRVKTYFNTGDLLKRIKAQFLETGWITNRYGRKIFIDQPLDNIMINYYAQSTGADVVLLGFSQILQRLKRSRPLGTIHDAMLIDVPEDEIDTVRSIESVKVHGYVQRFFVRCEQLS